MKMNEPLVSAIALPLPGADRLSLSVVIPVYNEETGLAALFARLWHHTTRPVMYGCGAALTPFMLKSACQGSASIPLILDEYKPVELGPVRTDLLLQTFRLSYNQAMGATGGISRGAATSSFRDVTQFEYSAPLVFMAESQETQTAIVQRTLPVSFTQRG